MEFGNTVDIKKTRKAHKCVCCGIIIPEGSSCTYTAGKFEGEFQDYYTCNYCEKWVDEHRKEIGWNYYWDEVYEMMYEEATDKCRSCEHWEDDANECEFEPNRPMKHTRCGQYSMRAEKGAG